MSPPRGRTNQIILVVSFLPFCWLAFMAVHELGHMLMAICLGDEIVAVVLDPFNISRTDVSPNSNPLGIAWAGAVFGVVFPMLLWAIAITAKSQHAFLAKFFAGFCLIANGAYLAFGSFDQVGDAGELIKHGSPMWHLWAFGTASIPLGLLLWHGLGPHFGLGSSKGQVDDRSAYVSVGLFTITFVLMFVFGR